MKWLSAGIAPSFLLLSSCKQDSPNGKEEPQVPTPPVVTAGTTVTIEPSKENTISHSGYEIHLPKGAVEEKTEIKVNTATQKDFQDPTYKALGDGIELSGNVNSLLSKGCEISFNNPNIPDGTEMYIALVYNTDEAGLRAIGDETKHRVRVLTKAVKRGVRTEVSLKTDPITGLVVEKCIIRPLEIIGASKLNQLLVEHQMPNMAEFGLKEVVLPAGAGKITLKDLSEITSKDKVLLFIHGWTSSPIACWSSFITGLAPLVKEAGYTKYLTMGYNTSMPIDKNGELLSLYLQNKLNGAKVDIVAHSMGGLVARSALENYGKADLVQNLITLGTPHKGSPMGIIKYALEAFSSAILEENGKLDEYGRFVVKMYNDGSQGFQDLYTESDFIKGLAKNEAPSTYYHPVAAIYSKGNLTGVGLLSRDLQDLMARADGVVTKESAWGIPASENNGKGVFFMLPGKMPHVTLTESEEVIHHVSAVLKVRAKVNPEPKLPEGVVIDSNGTLTLWPASAIPVNGHIVVPNNVKVIGASAFAQCRNLKTISLPKGLKGIDYRAFDGCTSLKKIVLPNSVKLMDDWIFANCVNLEEVVLPQNLKTIPKYTFQNCYKLSKIDLPETLQSIESAAFSHCRSLSKISLGDNLISLGSEVFAYCTSLESIVFPSSIQSVPHSCFVGCSKLKKVDLPTSIVEIEHYAFATCVSLTSLTIPQSVTTVRHTAVQGCSNLTTINCRALTPPGDYYNPNSYTIVYSGKLIVPIGTKELYKGSTAWRNCSSIEEED